VYVLEGENRRKHGSFMCGEIGVDAMETSSLKARSNLNPDAPVFVPAASYRAAVPDDFSSGWWTLMETDPAFRKVWMSSRFAGSDDEQVQFAEDFEELADLEEFLEYQDQLHLEEAVRELLDADIEDDVFCDDELDLVNVNACKELTKVQKPQTQWSKPSKNHDKIPNNYVNLPRKSHTYRIQQPRTVI
jgi:hypothetical protein